MEKLLFCDCTYHDGNLYFFSSQNGLLAKLDEKSKKVSYLPTIVEETYGRASSIDILESYRNKLYALKTAGDGLIEYDLKTDTYQCYDPECAENPWGNFILMTEYNSKIFLFTRTRDVIKIFNCDDKRFTTVEHDFEERTYYCGIRVDDVVWLFPKDGEHIVSFDLASETMQSYESHVKFENAVSCYEDDKKIYVLSGNGDVRFFHTDTLELSSFRIAKEPEQMGRIIVTGKNVILLPSLGDNIVVINKVSGSEKNYEDYPEEFKYQAHPTWSKYYGYCKDEKNIYVAMRSANHIMVINADSGEISWKNPTIVKEAEKLIFLKEREKLRFTEHSISLETIIKHLCSNQDGNAKMNISEKLGVGEDIWRFLT